MIKIEHNVPVQPAEKRREWVSLFMQMKSGDSFYFDDVSPESVKSCFGSYLARRMSRVVREGKGWRFHMK